MIKYILNKHKKTLLKFVNEVMFNIMLCKCKQKYSKTEKDHNILKYCVVRLSGFTGNLICLYQMNLRKDDSNLFHERDL